MAKYIELSAEETLSIEDILSAIPDNKNGKEEEDANN